MALGAGFFCTMDEFSGKAEAICPCGTLQRIIQKASEMGFDILSSFEYEFFVFNETPRSICEKNYHNMEPLAPAESGCSARIQKSSAPLLNRKPISAY